MNSAPIREPRVALERVLKAALASVDARRAVEQHLGRERHGFRVGDWSCSQDTGFAVLAIGKAAAWMAEGARAVLSDRIRSGLVITKDGHAEARDLGGFEVIEAGHPVPDERSVRAGRRALAFAEQTREDELLLVLLSGGASSLVSSPPDGVGLDDLARLNQILLACGADIRELNAVRKHVSNLSGGRLAHAAHASRIAVLAVSDVAGDAVDVIGSGPCAPDPSRFEDALGVFHRYGIERDVPESVIRHLERGLRGEVDESPKPGEETFQRVRHVIVASNAVARAAALAEASRLGAQAISLGECIQREARSEGARFAALAAAIRSPHPVCLVAGGESVVRLTGDGVGGRNQELALASAVQLSRAVDCEAVLLAVGTDGSDGPTDAAGAWADSGTLARGRKRSVDAQAALARNDSNSFFGAEGGLVQTGPTGTNVMDLVLIWVPPAIGGTRGQPVNLS